MNVELKALLKELGVDIDEISNDCDCGEKIIKTLDAVWKDIGTVATGKIVKLTEVATVINAAREVAKDG